MMAMDDTAETSNIDERTLRHAADDAVAIAHELDAADVAQRARA